MDGSVKVWSDGEFLDIPNDCDGTFQFETDSLLSGRSQSSGTSPGRSIHGIPTFRKWVCHLNQLHAPPSSQSPTSSSSIFSKANDYCTVYRESYPWEQCLINIASSPNIFTLQRFLPSNGFLRDFMLNNVWDVLISTKPYNLHRAWLIIIYCTCPALVYQSAWAVFVCVFLGRFTYWCVWLIRLVENLYHSC